MSRKAPSTTSWSPSLSEGGYIFIRFVYFANDEFDIILCQQPYFSLEKVKFLWYNIPIDN